MANVLTTNPIQIDTAGVIYTKGQPYSIKCLSFQASADDEDVLLSDADANIIWQGKAGDVSADGYNIDVTLDYHGNNGLTCTTIDGTAVLLIFA